MNIAAISKDVFTGRDGESYDVGRILWGLVALTFCLIAMIQALKGCAVSLQDFGIGGGAILAGGGGGVALKANTEPPVVAAA